VKRDVAGFSETLVPVITSPEIHEVIFQVTVNL